MRLDSILEYTHRVMAALTSLFIVASALLGRRNARSVRWVSRPLFAGRLNLGNLCGWLELARRVMAGLSERLKLGTRGRV